MSQSTLFFVPIITRALRQKDSHAALSEAFEQIRAMGRQATYAHGYRQFLQFMQAVRQHHESWHQVDNNSIGDELATLLVQQVTEILDNDLNGQQPPSASNTSPWQEQYEQLWADLCSVMNRPPIRGLKIEKDGHLVAAVLLENSSILQPVIGITPGSYQITLETGRIIWWGRLGEKDLLWSHALPDQPLQVAADSDETTKQPVRQFDLLDGVLRVNIYPGVESGTLEFEWRSQEDLI